MNKITIATRRLAGFSLIELLLAIAVIAILASILIPVVGKVREASQSTACLSNLRQISSATLLYANDNAGMLPPADTGVWPNNFVARLTGYGTEAGADYIGISGNLANVRSGGRSVFLCRSNIGSVASARASASSTYGMNSRLSQARMMDIKDPALLCLFGDATGPDWDLRMQPDGPAYRIPSKNSHNGIYHFAFMDGHVSAMEVYPSRTADTGFEAFWIP